jgi:tetratricopeptide (TPR) repeat protein
MTRCRAADFCRGIVLPAAWLICMPIVAGAQDLAPTPEETSRSKRDLPTAVTPIEAVALRGVEAQGAALLLSGQRGGDIYGALLWSATGVSGDGGDVSVPFVVEVDGRSLLDGSDGQRIPIEVYGYLVDSDGAVVGHVSEGILLDLERHSEAVTRAGLRFVGELQLPPGLYSLRVMVRNHFSGRFFLTRHDLEVPGKGASDPFLLPPLVPEPTDGRVIAGQHGLDTSSVVAALPGVEAWPSARPVLAVDEPIDVVFGCSELGETMGVSARLVNAVGRTIQQPELEVGERLAALDTLVFYQVSMAPIDVPAGHYRLVVELADENTGRTVSRSLPIAVRSEDEVPTWEDRFANSPPTGPRETRGKKLHPRTITALYTEALGLLAEGETSEARRALADVERRIIATASARQWMQLREAEWQTALSIAKAHPASLMALALFHRDMYHWYAARYEFELSEHSWTLAANLAEQTLRLGGWDPPQGFVECVLLDLAADQAKRGNVRRARTLLERAVELAPQDVPVLFGLGLVHEFSGRSYEATEYLQKLVDRQNTHYEARLRLAINRQRLGADRKAERLFRDLLSDPAPEWIHTIAYQELAQIYIKRESIDLAEHLLRAAIKRLPRNQRLRIQLAYVLDQAQRPWDATALIEELESGGSQFSTSPRVRYAEWPALDPARVRTTLANAREVGLEALREAYE